MLQRILSRYTHTLIMIAITFYIKKKHPRDTATRLHTKQPQHQPFTRCSFLILIFTFGFTDIADGCCSDNVTHWLAGQSNIDIPASYAHENNKTAMAEETAYAASLEASGMVRIRRSTRAAPWRSLHGGSSTQTDPTGMSQISFLY